jgi:hypothetical protein
MQISSLPINSSLQNNNRYQFSLKSDNIEILPILLAAILKIKMTLNANFIITINSSLQNNPRYKFSLKSENIEILPILSAAIRSQLFFGQNILPSYLTYMPSLVEIPLAVSDISEVKDIDIRSRFPWQRRPC